MIPRVALQGPFRSQIMACRTVRRSKCPTLVLKLLISRVCDCTCFIFYSTSKWGCFFYSFGQNFWKMKFLYSHLILLYHLKLNLLHTSLTQKSYFLRKLPIYILSSLSRHITIPGLFSHTLTFLKLPSCLEDTVVAQT